MAQDLEKDNDTELFTQSTLSSTTIADPSRSSTLSSVITQINEFTKSILKKQKELDIEQQEETQPDDENDSLFPVGGSNNTRVRQREYYPICE